MRKLLSLFLCISLIVGVIQLPITANAAEEFQEGIFTYTVSNNQASIIGCTETTGDLTIPSVIGGYEVVEITKRSFADSKNLRTISLPEGITVIGEYAFEGCTKLTDVKLPQTLNNIHCRAFKDCTSLKSITIPKNVTDSTSGNTWRGSWFIGCDNLTSITIEDEATIIPASAFENISTPCSINVPDTVNIVAKNAFTNSPNLTVYCSEYSPALIAAIDSDNNFHMTKEITSYENFVFANTDYITDYSAVSSSGVVNVELTYRFKDTVAGNVSDKEVVIRMPETVEYINSTIKVNGITATDFEVENNILTIPVTETRGTVSFCVEPIEHGRILSYALLSYRLDGEQKKDTIGVINQDIPLLTVKTDDVTANADITVSGIALPGKTVTFTCNGEKMGETTALKSGKYQTKLTIPEPKNFKNYIINAISEDSSSNEITAETTVTYQEGAPELTAFDMQYNNVSYNLFDAGTVKPTITFESGKPFSFRVKFNDNQKLDSVYIVSDRNNSIKKMKAEYDSSSDSYIAAGYFDENNHSYVPGIISVEYLQKNEPFLFSNEIDFTEDRYVNTLPTDWENAEITLNDAENQPIAKLRLTSIAENDLKGTIEFINDIKGKLDFNLFSETIPNYINEQNAAEYGYEKVTDDVGEELYIKVAAYADDKIQAQAISFAKGKFMDFLLENKYYGVESAVNTIGTLNSVLGDVDKMITYNQNRVDLKQAKQEVINSDRTFEQKQQALTRLENAQKANNATVAIMLLSTCLAMSGIALPAAGSLILAGLSYQNSNYVKSVLGDWTGLASRQSTGTNLTFRWKIDPSGYVYEGITSNRLEGVTATAYWIAPEYIDENGAGDETKAVLWDAAEYEQMNPLTTDVNGQYAWDVPEGLWQVEFKKEGYETVYSEWLPVPPPQTEVNIGLVSRESPEIEKAEWNGKKLKIDFTKPIKPETITNIKLFNKDDTEIAYEVSYDATETDMEGNKFCKSFEFTVADVPVSIKTSSLIESYANVGMTETTIAVSSPDMYCTYDVGRKTATVNSLMPHTGVSVLAAAYQDGRMISLKIKPVDLLAGSTNIVFDDLLTDYADTIKVMVWEGVANMRPLCDSCVVEIK